MSFDTLYIANRGEIALRIIRTARRLGLRTAIGVSDPDLRSRNTAEADEVIHLPGTASSETYLNIEAVIDAARQSGAGAVHPGYGFLSENSEFARAVQRAGMIFVGPEPNSLDAMGDKLKARAVAVEAGLPVVPGGEADNAAQAAAIATETGYPLLIKAVSGGGGRGMKRVDHEDLLQQQIDMAMAEALAAFGDKRIYVERYVESGRHIEVQVLGDGRRAIHLGTRDCSIQRRYQKLVEEAPAPDVPADALSAIENAAVKLTEHLGYKGAGTVEFLVDSETFEFFFLEMNARIQVEHPVTEVVTGIDLIEQQLTLAGGAPLGFEQRDIVIEGSALELRINAEDPAADFAPSPGFVARAAWPAGPGLRVDSHIRSGDTVPAAYDSLVGKIIAHGADRSQAIERAGAALRHLSIEGIHTTAPLHTRILEDARFANGAVDTRFFEGFEHG